MIVAETERLRIRKMTLDDAEFFRLTNDPTFLAGVTLLVYSLFRPAEHSGDTDRLADPRRLAARLRRRRLARSSHVAGAGLSARR